MTANDPGERLRQDDLVLWSHLRAGVAPVVGVAAGKAPAWVRRLPRLHSVVEHADAAACAHLPRASIVLVSPPPSLPAGTLAALRQRAVEILVRHGSRWRVAGSDAAPAQPSSGWLARMLQTAVDGFAIRWLTRRGGRLPLRPPFRSDGGSCFWAPLVRRPPAETTVILCEDGEPLAAPNSVHDDIRRLGQGRYSVWERGVFFAASDSSDPNTNERTYEAHIVKHGSEPGALSAPLHDEAAFTAAFARAAHQRAGSVPPLRRVLLLLSSLGPGGAERQFCGLALALRRRGIDVAICSLDGYAGAAGHYLPLLHAEVRTLDASTPDAAFGPGALAPPALDLLASLPPIFRTEAFAVATHVATFAPDVLHCALDKTNLLGAVAGVIAAVPRIVLSLRNVNPTHFPYLDVEWFQRWYREAAKVPGLVLSANSRAGGADYAQWLGLPQERVRVVHNGFDPATVAAATPAAAAALREELRISDTAPVIAGVFRLSAEKRPRLWLEVIAALRLRWPELHALHVGEGLLDAEFTEAIHQLGLRDCVHRLGRRTDATTALRAADLLLLASTFEGIPNVALEAQWLERPVVCTEAGGSGEAVRDGVTGLVVAEPAATPLAAACARVLGDPVLRARMGKAGRALVADEFAMMRMVEGTLGLYG